jgi:hypothetical protein
VGGPETPIMHDYKIEEITELLRLAKTASEKFEGLQELEWVISGDHSGR